jgi:hypothetical protein
MLVAADTPRVVMGKGYILLLISANCKARVIGRRVGQCENEGAYTASRQLQAVVERQSCGLGWPENGLMGNSVA